MRRSNITLVFLLVLLVFPFSMATADTIPIDLNQFYADPASVIDISADGSSATMYEDTDMGFVLLSDDPGLGDPDIIYTQNMVSLSFSYSFVEGAGNDDVFYAWLFDSATYALIDELWVEDTSSGSVSWDLSGLYPSVSLLGLEFQLNSYDFSFDSYAEISNVSINPVPEPCTMVLLGSGLIGFIGVRRRKTFMR